ncbi:Transport protein Avl9 [Geosmithia morbida]|uniref:Transport protein Avl9 n=1 Tax=Geosmithia morbida TaxID=1094350 RepID=A0A9P4Z370_9HYPO|nr:Transport protein Avl9 [Geosmithia morbida]KAF4126865.1 Transport protein Avl9 [Geosmithia morbida]
MDVDDRGIARSSTAAEPIESGTPPTPPAEHGHDTEDSGDKSGRDDDGDGTAAQPAAADDAGGPRPTPPSAAGTGPTTGTATPSPVKTPRVPFTPLVTVVGFHHARGPEVESWFGVDEGVDPAAKYNWGLLPFMALSDGAHASEEEFSYFTLLKPESSEGPATSLFGISCTRQLDSTQLINRPDDVTRSTVQKAVVVIADSPKSFGLMRQRLGIVTKAWFDQRDFTDVDILKRFQESLSEEKSRGILEEEADRDQYIGMSLRELVHEFRWQTLVLLKCCLLQPKMLFFGSKCDRLCMVQFALVSLIPGLMRNLQDCADPELNSYETGLTKPTSLQSSNRNSLLSFMGLPLQVFGKGSLFGPYTPLQQLDVLADFGTKSYIVGSTNSLLLQQKDRYSDILINLDEDSVSITSSSLRQALALTAADRRWIDYLTHEVNETWDESDPSRPNNMQYAGSEEFIRSQFEAYILGLISSVKYHNYLVLNGGADVYGSSSASPATEADPAIDYGLDWVEAWSRTTNYRMWDANTDANLFAVSEPRHPCAGGLTIEDVQRRIADQVKDLHIDERLAQGRDMLGRNLAAGRDKASTMFSRIYSDVEYLRESQRRRAEDAAAASNPAGTEKTNVSSPSPSSPRASSPSPSQTSTFSDIIKAQQQTAGARASAYMSSWAAWAGEKRKTSGWGASWGSGRNNNNNNNNNSNSNNNDNNSSSGSSNSNGKSRSPTDGANKPTDDASWSTSTPTPMSPGSRSSEIDRSAYTSLDSDRKHPGHSQQPSFSESILSGVTDESGRPATGHSSSASDSHEKKDSQHQQS